MRWLKRIAILTAIAGTLCLSGAALVTHYLFQEPAHVTWSRHLMPEFLWQRQNYPSMRWAFNLMEPLVRQRDPRLTFVDFDSALPLDGPSSWSSHLFGAQLASTDGLTALVRETIRVSTVDELKGAIGAARPGNVIEIQPGIYDFSGTNISIATQGEPGLPITLRAAELGSVRLRFDLLEGFHVQAPFWIFENLIVEGVCRNDSRCEHAFHIVGSASGVIIRNNWVADFNAAVKVNGKGGVFPDQGTITHNTFVNQRPRNTDKPVAVLDFVAASKWHIRRNVIADFAKAGGNYTSYGAFFKGGGEDNIFEQNLIRCEWRHGGGARVGFSFGNGGTGKRHCRDRRCDVEHRHGIARNNIIMNCPNDVGIYLFKSAETRIQNNAVVNTRGIDIHLSGSTSLIENNVVDGRILTRGGDAAVTNNNIVSPLKAMLLGRVSAEIYADPEGGDFRLLSPEDVVGRGASVDHAGRDLCDQSYSGGLPDIGPLQYRLGLTCTPRVP